MAAVIIFLADRLFLGSAVCSLANLQLGLYNDADVTEQSTTSVTYKLADGKQIRAVQGADSLDSCRAAYYGLDPIPATVHVHVSREFGFGTDPHEKRLPDLDIDVPVAGRIPDEANFSGTLWLVVTNDNVYLAAETLDEEGARYEEDEQHPLPNKRLHAPTTLPTVATTKGPE